MKKMKILGISGSPRVQGNTFGAMSFILDAFREQTPTTDTTCRVIELATSEFSWCTGCGTCRKKKRCIIEDDLQDIYQQMKAADLIILGCPVYGGSMAAPMKMMLDRFSHWSNGDDRAFERKIGVPLVTARRAGQNAVHAELLMWMYIRGFCMIGHNYWNVCFGSREKDEWKNDAAFRRNVPSLVTAARWLYDRLHPQMSPRAR